MPICAVGDPDDLTTVYVVWLARRRGLMVLELSEAALGADWAFAFEDERPDAGRLQTARGAYPFAELDGVFVRLHPQPALPPGPALSPEEADLFVAERRAGLQYLLDRLPCAVVNRPRAGRSNGSKPYQMRQLAAAGFDVPRWVASNDPATVRDFARTCAEGAIYKACSGLRSRVRRLDDELLRRLASGTSPVVVQEYVPGRDVRVHVVRRRVFATGVRSHGVDYRFDTEGNEFFATEAPPPIARRCVAVAEREGLPLAGFDFRVTEAGRWYCLEVNPVPTFLPYEASTGQPIGDAVVDALTGL
jgi:glutathione synthase/RimK-type ligase-like ATP-grasp enzyme